MTTREKARGPGATRMPQPPKDVANEARGAAGATRVPLPPKDVAQNSVELLISGVVLLSSLRRLVLVVTLLRAMDRLTSLAADVVMKPVFRASRAKKNVAGVTAPKTVLNIVEMIPAGRANASEVLLL